MEHTAWLVEWPENDNMPVRWWHPELGWVRNANKALHLSRKQDAEAIIKLSFFSSRAMPTEHKFVAGAEPSQEWDEARDGIF